MADGAAAPAAPAVNAPATGTDGAPPPAEGGGTPAPKAAVPEAFKPYKFKSRVAGKDFEREYKTQHELDTDLGRIHGLGAAQQEAAAARKEAAALKKMNEEFIEAVAQSPYDSLAEIARARGIPEAKLREQLKAALTEREEYEKIPEEQRRYHEQVQEQARKLKELEAEKATAAETEKQAGFRRQVEQNDREWTAEHMEILKEFPEYTPEFAQERVLPEIARIQEIARQGKYRLSPKAAAAEARKTIGSFVEGHVKQMPADEFGKVVGAKLGTMTPEEIGNVIGPEKLREVARWMVDSARKRQGAAPPQANGAPRPATSEDERQRQQIKDLVKSTYG